MLKRRDFVKLTMAASVGTLVPSCAANGEKDATPQKQPDRFSGRDELLQFEGLTSIHDHINSEKAAELMLRAMDNAGIAKMNLLGCYESLMYGRKKPDFSGAAANNELLLRVVKKHPDRFSMFALINGLEDDPVATLIDYIERGASGVKLYNGTANKYRTMPLSDDRLRPFWRFCALHGVPILIHVDPPHLDEFLNLIRDYPSIPWICPHLLVQTKPNQLDRLAQTLRKYPNLLTDMSFGFEGWMHANLTRLSKSRDRIRDIFIKHANQIVFGTDIVFSTNRKHRTVAWATNSLQEYRKFLEFDMFHHRVRGRSKIYEGTLNGLALPEKVLKKIYVDNANKLLTGKTIRTEKDDLDTVLHRLPGSARLDDNGRHFVLAAAAVATLSPFTEYQAGANSGPHHFATTPKFAGRVASIFSLTSEKIKLFEKVSSLKDYLSQTPKAVGILPFSEMDSRLRALPVNGVDVMDSGIGRCAEAGQATRAAYFSKYPLLFPVVDVKDADLADARFDPFELRTVQFTGGSLLGPGMLEKPTVSPEQAVVGVAAISQTADIAHLSIENVKLEGCRQNLKKWRFCYEPHWQKAIDRLGTDVIELTGNHVRDFGSKRLSETIDWYNELKYPYYGGGRNLADALTPAVIEIRGLKIGFTGLNRLNSTRSGASKEKPGPLLRGNDNFLRSIKAAQNSSDVFFFTYQGGYEFSPFPWNDMVRYAHAAIDAGAIGAVGVHAHMPMGSEVYRGAFVSYGLGNFLFRHPPTTRPRRKMTERALIMRVTLYHKQALQVRLIPVEQNNGALSLSKPANAAQTMDRVRLASREGLAPQRPLQQFADSCIELSSAKRVSGPLDVQRKLGLTGQLIGLTYESAQQAGTTQNALEILENARTKRNHIAAKGLKIAIPLLPLRTLPAGEYDAVRLLLDSDRDDAVTLMKTALEAEKPIQLVVQRPASLSLVKHLVDMSQGTEILLSGIPALLEQREKLSTLLRQYRHLYVDTSAINELYFGKFFTALERDIEGWRKFFRSFEKRVLLATGAACHKKKLTWRSQGRLLRALRHALEYENYHLPILDQGHISEWGGYEYTREPVKTGLSLPAAVIDSIAGQNFISLFGK